MEGGAHAKAASPKRAHQRARVAQMYFLNAGKQDKNGRPEDLDKPYVEYSSQLASLRRTRFDHERVRDLIKVIKDVDAKNERAFRLKKGEMPPARPVDAFVEDVSTQLYADAIELDIEDAGYALASCTCLDDEGNVKVVPLERKRLATLAKVPLSWCVAKLPRDRHKRLSDADKAVESVLFAEVVMPQAAMSRMAQTTWLEVVPRSYAQKACDNTEFLFQPSAKEEAADTLRLEALMAGVWADTTFRGVRSLFDKISMLYLGVGIADVKEFVRKQELKQMRVPRVAAVSTPLVPTALGWHQIDIMYATWDRGATSKEDKALKEVADAQENNVLVDGQKLRYTAALKAEKEKQKELQREKSKSKAERDEAIRARRAVEAQGLKNAFYLEDSWESVSLQSLRLNTLINPNEPGRKGKSRDRNPSLQLELLANWTGAEYDKKGDTWTFYGWIPLVQAYMAPYDEHHAIFVQRESAKRAMETESFLQKIRGRRAELVKRYDAAPKEARNAEEAFAYDWASLEHTSGPKHTPLSKRQTEAYLERVSDAELYELDAEDKESQVDRSVQTMNEIQAKLDSLQTDSPVDDSDAESSASFLQGLAGGAKDDDSDEGARKRGPVLTHPYVLNIMDIFSKYAWSYPLRDQEGSTTAKILNELWLKEGAPLKLQSDGGFGSRELGRLANRFGVKLEVCAPYKSQCSGAIERLNRTIRESIRSMVHAYGSKMNGAKWIHYLPNIVASYNAQKHSTTQLSPFMVQRGFEPRALRPQFFDELQDSEPAVRKVEVCEHKEPEDIDLAGGASCAVVHGLDGGLEMDPTVTAQIRTLDMAAKVTRAVLAESEPKRPTVENAQIVDFMRASKQAEAARTEFVQRGIRHGALNMTVDALIKAEDSMKPLSVGHLVRVSVAYMDRTVRKELKVGMKRAQDLKRWSSTVYVVDKEPLKLWLGSAERPVPSSQAQRSPRPLRESDPRFKNFYTVFPCLPSAEEPGETFARFVPRQDLLQVSETKLSEASQLRAKSGLSVAQELAPLVALRESLPPLVSFLG